MSEQELSKAYDPTEVEGRWYPFWMEKGYFRAEATSRKPPFSITLPPPNVTGSLHLGHALTATLEDILIRWKRMSGHNALWQAGTDHAGIATQMVVEKELKKTEKKSRHDLGRKAFLDKVWEWKHKYGARITEQFKVLGASLDWSRERFTLDEKSSNAVREVFVRLYEEGLIYRASKLINWCPQDHTALSDLEVEHEEKQSSLWYLRYPVEGTSRHLTVATTRPETMLGDTAVAVHPDDPRYKDLIGKKVRLPLVDRLIPIIGDAELVSMEFGTGAVKVTPAHDFNDYQVGLRHKLPMISIFDENARTNKDAGAYAGVDRYEARKKVLADLEAQGLLEKTEPHVLSVGTCQRCSAVVEPRLSPQWFVKIEPLAKPAIEAVEKGRTRFVPENWTNVYFNWMRNIHDWCISRQLWWGHQIPAYYCKSCSPRLGDDTDLPLDAPTTRVGGIDYSRAEPIVGRAQPAQCPKCSGKTFEQDPDVLDTWFSSALWPFSTLGWPEKTQELQTFYPTSVMETGHDIIFFWVARMMMMGIHFMGDVPFRTVYLHAMVRDEKGEKMSKTKGNVIDPLDVIRGASIDQLAPTLKNKFPQGMPAFGADALRFTLAALTQQGRDIKLSVERVGGYRAFCNKLWNATRFAMMNMGEWRDDGRHPKSRSLTLADRWILARLNRAIAGARASLDQYAFADAANTLYQFVWAEFCDWYIELAKGSLYGQDETAKEATRAVLVHCLDRVMRLLHPFMPFITEEIWQKLPIARATESIMIASYPEPDGRLEDAAAEAEMAPVVAAIEGIRSIRGENNLPPQTKVRAVIQSADARTRELLERWKAYLMPLAGLSEVSVGEPGPKPAQSAAVIGSGMEIFVPLAGLIDFDEERGRIGKEIAKLDQDLGGLLRKLENPNFVAKAPPDVVEKDRARVDELKARKAKLEENLKRLAPEGTMGNDEKAPPHLHPNHAIPDADTAKVKIAPPSDGNVDLRKDPQIQADLKAAEPPQMDATVEDSLEKLREGTKEGLSAKDHYDLGVAYLGMGLVDDAVREFNTAGEGKPKAMKKAPAAKAPKKAPAKKAAPKKPAAKKAAPARKAKKPAARKTAAKKPAKKAAGKKPARKPVAKKAAKKPVRKAAAKKPVKAKKPVRKARR
jgi:valyl-tRNA synthetase